MSKKLSYNNLYVSIFGIMIFLNTLKNSFIRNVMPIEQSVSLVKILLILLALPLLYKIRLPLKKLILLILTFIIFLISSLVSSDWNTLLVLSVIIAGANIQFKKFVVSASIGILSSIFVVLTFISLKLIPNVQTFRSDGSVRNGLGFIQPVVLPNLITFLLIFLGYLFYKKIGLWYIFTLIPAYIVYIFCDSRGAFFRGVLIVIVFTFSKKIKWTKKKIDLLYQTNILLMIFGILGTFYLAINYNSGNTVMNKISQFMTGRPFWWNRFWELYDSKLFGQELIRVSSSAVRDGNSESMMILDNAYLSLWLESGVLVFCILIFMIYKTLGALKKDNDYLSLAIWFSFLLFSITANSGLKIDSNIFLLQIGLIYKEYAHNIVQEPKLKLNSYSKYG